MPRHEKILGYVVLAAVVILFVSSIPGHYSICVNENPHKENCPSYSLTPFLVFQAYKAIHSLEGVITAFATFAIAYFTWTIWRVNTSQLTHSHKVERAYISGGGNRNQVFSHLSGVNDQPVYKPGNEFVFRVNNYGKTPGTVYKLGYGFCDESDIPAHPAYMFEYYRMEIIPGQRGEILLLKPIPAQFTNPVVYGRFYYRTIFDTCHSSGFIYRIPPDTINVPIKPPSNSYIEQQDESSEEADPF